MTSSSKMYSNNGSKVIEIPTGNIVYEGNNAKKVAKKLNSGAGFRGLTPEFILRPVFG